MKRDDPANKANLRQYSRPPKVKLTPAQLAENLRLIQEQLNQLAKQVESLTDRLPAIRGRSCWQRMFRR